MSLRGAHALVIASAGVAAAMIVSAAVGCIVTGATWQQVVDRYELTNTVVGASFVVSGASIAWFVHRNPVGWLFLASGMAHLTTAALFPVAAAVVIADPGSVAGAWIATIAGQVWGFGIPGLFLVALLVFPDGRLRSRWGWLLIGLLAFAGVGQGITGVLDPGSMLPGYDVPSPIAQPGRAPETFFAALDAAGAITSVGVLVTLVLRYVRGDERVRRQLLWVVLAVLVIFGLNLQRFLTGDGPIPLLLTFVLIPVAIAIAIVRHGLLDIRLVLSRTLVYATLVAAIVAVYAGLVAALTLLLPSGTDRGAAVGAAIVVAFAFNPLRLLLQRTVGRALYGDRHDPAGVASRLGGELVDATDTLDGVLAVACRELRLPRLAVVDAGTTIATSGTAVGETAVLALPGAGSASLEVGLRLGERVLHDADRRALGLLASSIAVALRAITLNAALGAARAAIVDEREVERQRLQRELHDGVGPLLTGVAFRLDAAANLAATSPSRSAELLAEARTDLRGAISTVREVVHELRPIDLETDGLAGALRTRLEAIAATTGVPIELDVAERLPVRSAAADLAAYRIVIEAVMNAVRHAPGSTCRVVLAEEHEALRLEITDDGAAKEHWRPGVGIGSMRHRAEELGGRLEAGPTPSGWLVAASLPTARATGLSRSLSS